MTAQTQPFPDTAMQHRTTLAICLALALAGCSPPRTERARLEAEHTALVQRYRARTARLMADEGLAAHADTLTFEEMRELYDARARTLGLDSLRAAIEALEAKLARGSSAGDGEEPR